MDVTVTGKHMEVGEAMQAHAAKEIEALTEKYLDRSVSCHVVFSKAEHHKFRVDAVMLLGTKHGIVVKSHAIADDPYVTFDIAADKITMNFLKPTF